MASKIPNLQPCTNRKCSGEDLDILVQAFDETYQVKIRALNSDVPTDNFIEGVMGEPVFKGLRERNAVSN
jgi:hypothetical protein